MKRLSKQVYLCKHASTDRLDSLDEQIPETDKGKEKKKRGEKTDRGESGEGKKENEIKRSG